MKFQNFTRFSPGFEKSPGFHQVFVFFKLGENLVKFRNFTRFSPGFEKSPGFDEISKFHQVFTRF